MPGRNISSSSYRYGFNGQEKTTEINSDGNLYNAEYWEYDSRIVRRWNPDPMKKYYESPYAAFGNNPISFADPNGDDTVDVKSRKFDATGKIKGQKGFNKDNMLALFSAYTPEKTGANDANGNPTENRYSLFSDVFNNKYSISTDQAFGYLNDVLISRIPASVLSINKKSPFFYNAVARTNIQTLESLRQAAVGTLKGRWLSPLDLDKLKYFNNNAQYDIKSKQLKSFAYTYLDGVGLMESDYIGNIFYGSVMSNFENLSSALYDGDFLQRTGIDDAYDSHAIIIGYKFGKQALTLSTFQSIQRVQLDKFSTAQGKYFQQYKISINKGSEWKDQTINTSNY
jgi:RHS repeat-associated protein